MDIPRVALKSAYAPGEFSLLWTLPTHLEVTINKLLLPLALVVTLAPVAGACSVKAGYVAKGLLATPAGMRQECGLLYRTFSKPSLDQGTAKWVELYEVSASGIGPAGKKIQTALERAGFVQMMSKDVEGGYQFGFANVKTKKLVMLQIMTINDVMFLGVLGN